MWNNVMTQEGRTSRKNVKEKECTEMANSEKQKAVFRRFHEIGIIPVVVIEDPSDAEALAGALVRGGLPAAEVTFRTSAAEESIRIMRKAYPDMLVGAGTVLTIEQVERAVGAGARFIVSPGFDPEIVKYCLKHDIPVCPGTQTPSEMIAAMNLGLDHLKFFPAEASGGVPMIKAVTSALTSLEIMPTGGINADNAESYLREEKIFCAGGSWMVKKDLIASGNFDEIEQRTREAAAIVKKVHQEA